MDFDYGVIIGLIVTVCGAGVLGLSYLGVFLRATRAADARPSSTSVCSIGS